MSSSRTPADAKQEAIRRNEQIKQVAQHHYADLLRHFLPDAEPALAKKGRHITCPYHGGKDDFRVHRQFDTNGKIYCTCGVSGDIFHAIGYVHNWTFAEVMQEVGEYLRVRPTVSRATPTRAISPKPQVEDDRPSDEAIRRGIQRIWTQSMPIDDPDATLGRRYLRHRWIGSLALPLANVGFHPALPYYNSKTECLGKSPALVCLVRRLDGTVSTVHRTWLSDDGTKKSSAFPEPRKQYLDPTDAPCMGAAVQLDEAIHNVLHLAEGLETALTVRAITQQPTWCCLNKELLQAVELPAHVDFVVIWADRDRSFGGQDAAFSAMDRFKAEGRRAIVFLPPFPVPEAEKSVDWNDVVKRYAAKTAYDYAVSRGTDPHHELKRLLDDEPACGLVAVRSHFEVARVLSGINKAVRLPESSRRRA